MKTYRVAERVTSNWQRCFPQPLPAADEVVFHSVPSEGLLIGSLAVSATQEPDGDAEQAFTEMSE